MMAKVDDLVDAYHSSLTQALAPSSETLHSFSKLFVVVWVYTAAPTLALKELNENSTLSGDSAEIDSFGFMLAIGSTVAIALFYFGLYELGSIMDKSVEAVTRLLPLDDLSYTLSGDLTDLVDDPEDSVPVFLTPDSA